eukprot:TRINITY_DN7204_c0_g1_i1.p2 TRINITY_DN7204_c0_g1~~TRINITY_DN7204_c0_g1_i1.p2  ORF type:complete len:246 (+),score=60.08 TRINITY_DN7204_c0_g1_i1:822-1559(+)
MYFQRLTNANVPADAIVTGIRVAMRRRASAPGLRDVRVELVLRDQPLAMSNQFADSAGFVCPGWHLEETNVVFGGEHNLWSLPADALTPAVVNSASFGVVLQITNAASHSVEAFLDELSVIVFYALEPPAAAQPASVSEPAVKRSDATLPVSEAPADAHSQLDPAFRLDLDSVLPVSTGTLVAAAAVVLVAIIAVAVAFFRKPIARGLQKARSLPKEHIVDIQEMLSGVQRSGSGKSNMQRSGSS